MALFEMNRVGNASRITVTTDVTLFNITDYDPRTGGNVTTRYNTFEPTLLIATNPSTTTSTLIELYDVDRTNAVTATGTPRYAFQLAAGETKMYTYDELNGTRFYFDVDVLSIVNVSAWMAIYGQEIV